MVSVIGLLNLLCYAFLVAIFIRIAFSWVSRDPFHSMRNPLYRICFQVTEPVLAPVRNLVPPAGGIDLSPMIVTFVLFMILNLLSRAG